MSIIDLIVKKRDRGKFSTTEIGELIDYVCNPEIPDYQISALLMALYLNGLDDDETSDLTRAMATSGDTLNFPNTPGAIIDKHSTGGVGDKTSLVLVPLLAAAGLKVAKLSGRGLGHTGGTLDKLGVFDGFQVDLNKTAIEALVNENGMVISGQTDRIVPADKRLYSLRDLTGTVESMPLIASSIMSKKIASGARYILLDVKVGSGAMFSDPEKAKTLALKMVGIGKTLGVPTKAVLTDMNVPLGKMVGNALEVREAIDTLHGGGDQRFRELCIRLASKALALTSGSNNDQQFDNHIVGLINSGKAFDKFRLLISSQGGDLTAVDHPEMLPLADFQKTLYSDTKGYISGIEAKKIGIGSMVSGAGRSRKEDKINLGAGVELHVSLGDSVNKGSPLATVYASDSQRLAKAIEVILPAFTYALEKPDPSRLILAEY
ncbi:MAG: thymidine phosphorylase [Saprospiraceae bacterium]|nr:thymidine phosphorylase [Saprospiraceae bacterium]